MAGQPDKSVKFEFGDETYSLILNNAGRAFVESELDMELPEIDAKINEFGIGPRLQAGLFFGATRKHHRRQFQSIGAVYELLDEIEEAGEETQIDFLASLMSTLRGTDKERWVKLLNGEDIEDEEDNEEAPKGKTKSPKKKSTKAESSDAEPGTDS